MAQTTRQAPPPHAGIRLTVLGCGDAFGTGGRLQTCYHLATSDGAMLIDCGATSLIGLQRQGLDPDGVRTIFVSHLHGDHFAGLVWWLLHAQHVARRSAPLTVVGPPGTEQRFGIVAEALFAGSTTMALRFEMRFIEYVPGEPLGVGGVRLTTAEVVHPSGAPSCGLRLEVAGRVVAFSGDTEWTEALVPLAADADIFISECYAYDKPVRYHTTWAVLAPQLPRLTARRILLTHMGADMLDNRHKVDDPRILLAEDGLALEL